MNDGADRLARALRAIDAANAKDPTLLDVDGHRRPAEQLYGERMSLALERFSPNPSETLMIAARGRRIERWNFPRSAYPLGRIGYHAWRRQVRAHHAWRLALIMREERYPEQTVARVEALVRKELTQDSEAKILEDVSCLVFLTYYVGPFAARQTDEKLGDILGKVWRRMSEDGRAAAQKLDLPDRVISAIESGSRLLSAG